MPGNFSSYNSGSLSNAASLSNSRLKSKGSSMGSLSFGDRGNLANPINVVEPRVPKPYTSIQPRYSSSFRSNTFSNSGYPSSRASSFTSGYPSSRNNSFRAGFGGSATKLNQLKESEGY